MYCKSFPITDVSCTANLHKVLFITIAWSNRLCRKVFSVEAYKLLIPSCSATLCSRPKAMTHNQQICALIICTSIGFLMFSNALNFVIREIFVGQTDLFLLQMWLLVE